MANNVVYIVQFSGQDMPGLHHAVAVKLQKNFNIERVSAVTGAGMQDTFVACSYESGPDASVKHDSKTIAVHLRKEVEAALTAEYNQHYESRQETPPAIPVVTVKEYSKNNASIQFYVEFEAEDKRGLFAAITEAIQEDFNIDGCMVKNIYFSTANNRKVKVCTLNALLGVKEDKKTDFLGGLDTSSTVIDVKNKLQGILVKYTALKGCKVLDIQRFGLAPDQKST